MPAARTNTGYKRRKTTATKYAAATRTVPRAPRLQIHQISRTVDSGNITSAGETVKIVNGSFAFRLGDLPGYTDFTSLFDQYRIDKARIDFFPNMSGNVAGTYGNDRFNIFHMAVDHTDATAPNNPGDIYQYDKHRSLRPFQPFSITLKPAPADVMWQGTTSSGYGPKPGAWVDSKSSTVQHYGVKWSWECNYAQVTSIATRVTMWISFKEPN